MLWFTAESARACCRKKCARLTPKPESSKRTCLRACIQVKEGRKIVIEKRRERVSKEDKTSSRPRQRPSVVVQHSPLPSFIAMSFSTSATPRRRPPRARGAAGALTPVAASALIAPSSSLVPMTVAVPSSSLSNGVGPVPSSSLRVVSSYAPSQASDDGMDAVPSAPANQSLAGPGHDKVWVRDGRLEVWGKSDLPAEIEELLHDAGTFSHPLSH